MAEYIDKQRVIDIINTTCPDFNIPEINDSWAHKLIVIIREALVELVEKELAADVRCAHGDGVTVEVGGVPVDPCVYKEVETHHGCTVHILECVNCGHVEIEWEREDKNGDT